VKEEHCHIPYGLRPGGELYLSLREHLLEMGSLVREQGKKFNSEKEEWGRFLS